MSLTGNLEDLGIGDILQILFLSRRSGILNIKGSASQGKIYFQQGMIVTAVSSIVKNSLIDLLLDSGFIKEKDIKKAMLLTKGVVDRKRLYKSVMDAFHIPEEKFEMETKKRIEKIVFSLFLEEGTFDFELKESETIFEHIRSSFIQIVYDKPGLNPQYLAMEGTRLIDEHKKVSSSLSTSNESTKIPGHEVSDHDRSAQQIPIKSRESFRGEVYEDSSDKNRVPMDRSQGTNKTPGLLLLRSMVYELQNPHTITEITLLILRFASELMNRAVLLMVKKNYLSGHGQFGVFLENTNADRVVRGIKIPLDQASIFHEAIKHKIAIKKKPGEYQWDNYFLDLLGGKRPVEAFVAPLVVNQKIVAVLYGDNVPEERAIGDTESLEIFLFHACMAMERSILEKRITTYRPPKTGNHG